MKRRVRIVHGEQLLEEKLGRNDLCPCDSSRRLKKCCLKAEWLGTMHTMLHVACMAPISFSNFSLRIM
ncbi:MAG: SEC-C metal-binding domain-containing protein [Fuerstiella sp.]